jgi:hyperosmotically inducible protein
MKTKLLLISGLLSTSLVLSGCVAAVAGGAAAGGYYAAKDKGSVGTYTDDSVITTKIKTKFLADIHLKSYNISVTTNKGVVYLSGSVPNQKMRDLAIDTARNTKGVKLVNVTNLSVESH